MKDPFISEGWAEKLHVVTVISNPINYNSRYELYFPFEKMIKDMGAILWTVELAYGERSFVVTQKDNPFHLQLRDGGPGKKGVPIWSKECMANLMINRIATKFPEAQYFSLCDADVVINIPDWPEKVIQKLNLHSVIQPWSHAQDLGPEGMPLDKKPETSFCYNWYNAKDKDKLNWDHTKYSGGVGHPGYIIAFTKEAYNIFGSIIDYSILGSGDRNTFYGLVGQIERSVHKDIHPKYLKWLKQWQVHARKLHRNIGYLPGLITHHWHGPKNGKGIGRQYSNRWEILVRNQYNPEVDLKRDWQGLWVLTERNWKLRHEILKYFELRGEDDIRVD